MAFTYDASVGADKDKVRLLIGDTDTVTAAKQIFSDDEITLLLSEAGADIYRAAGLAMMSVASSSARIAIMCSIGSRDVVTDRKAVAKECRDQAAAFFEQSKTGVPYATEVALEDLDQTNIENMGDPSFNYDTAIDELNT